MRKTPLQTVVRYAALSALVASLTASRLAADELAAVLDDHEFSVAAAIALGSVGDYPAMPLLFRLMLPGGDEPRLAEAFRAVARAGADPQEPVAAARQVLAALPDVRRGPADAGAGRVRFRCGRSGAGAHRQARRGPKITVRTSSISLAG